MGALPNQTKTRRRSGIRLAVVMAVLGSMAARSPGPALSGDQKPEEAYEKYGSGMAESKLYGTVQNIPSDRIGTWKVNGRTVKVTIETRITEEYGKAVAGAYVEVVGDNTGKFFSAHKIEVKRAKR